MIEERSDPRSLIRSNRHLETLSSDTINDLAAVSVLRLLDDGEVLASRDRSAPGIAIVVSGGLRSTTLLEDGREYVFSVIRAGDIWGVVSSVDGATNANDVYAHGETQLLLVDRPALQRILARRLDLNRSLLTLLCHRLRMANAVIEDRALKPITVRLARLLLSLAADRDGTEPIRATQDFLASLLGCTRPTVNAQLKALERDGITRRSYGGVRILDRGRLLALCGGEEIGYF